LVGDLKAQLQLGRRPGDSWHKATGWLRIEAMKKQVPPHPLRAAQGPVGMTDFVESIFGTPH